VRKIFTLLVMWLSVGLSVGLLTGCTPEYNWRETMVAEDRAVIMFPSRTQTEQRPIDVEGIQTTFSLTTAAVDQAVFSVGFIPLPETLGQEKARLWSRQWCLRSLRGPGNKPLKMR